MILMLLVSVSCFKKYYTKSLVISGLVVCLFVCFFLEKSIMNSYILTTRFQTFVILPFLFDFSFVHFPNFLPYLCPPSLVFFFPVVLRNNWHASLYKFSTYSMMLWFTHIVKWLPQVKLTFISLYRYNNPFLWCFNWLIFY